jgi:hypothetical protein
MKDNDQVYFKHSFGKVSFYVDILTNLMLEVWIGNYVIYTSVKSKLIPGFVLPELTYLS